MPRRARRTFTPQFKAEVVLALLTGEQSAAELCQRPRVLSERGPLHGKVIREPEAIGV